MRGSGRGLGVAGKMLVAAHTPSFVEDEGDDCSTVEEWKVAMYSEEGFWSLVPNSSLFGKE